MEVLKKERMMMIWTLQVQIRPKWNLLDNTRLHRETPLRKICRELSNLQPFRLHPPLRILQSPPLLRNSQSHPLPPRPPPQVTKSSTTMMMMMAMKEWYGNDDTPSCPIRRQRNAENTMMATTSMVLSTRQKPWTLLSN